MCTKNTCNEEQNSYYYFSAPFFEYLCLLLPFYILTGSISFKSLSVFTNLVFSDSISVAGFLCARVLKRSSDVFLGSYDVWVNSRFLLQVLLLLEILLFLPL